VSEAVGRVERGARAHRGVHTSADITLRDGVCAGWGDAALILWIARALLNGRGRSP